MKKALALFLLYSITGNQISYAQNIGIGTSTPTRGRLEVFGAVGTTTAIFGADGAGISLQRNYPAIGFNDYFSTTHRIMVPGTAMVQYLDLPSGSFAIDVFPYGTSFNQIVTNQIRRLTISQKGNLALSTNEKDATLFVSGHILGLTTARFRGTTYHTTFAERVTGNSEEHTYINAGKLNGDVYINDQGLGNVSIGTGNSRVGINSPNPTAVIELKQVAGRGLLLVAPAFSFHHWEFAVNHVNTEPQSDLWVYYNEQYRGNFFSVDGLYYPFSDRRLKNNIEPLTSTLEKVMALKPVEYEMKFHNKGHIRSIGFIAQEVKPLFPELTQIIEGEEHGYKGISDLHTLNYDALGPIAIKAIQEQQQNIADLTKRNSELRKRIDAAEKVLEESNNLKIIRK